MRGLTELGEGVYCTPLTRLCELQHKLWIFGRPCHIIIQVGKPGPTHHLLERER